jgi:hypothetical protein
LRGEAIYQYEITTKKFTTHFFQDFGRLRELTIGPDSFIYLTTSNLDGRGQGRTEMIRLSIKSSDIPMIKITYFVHAPPLTMNGFSQRWDMSNCQNLASAKPNNLTTNQN